MKTKILVWACLPLMVLVLIANSSLAKKSTKDLDRNDYLQQEMQLLNAYLKSLNMELDNPEIQMDQLQMLSDLILDTAHKIKRTKHGQVFHNNLKNLLSDVKMLHKLAKRNNYPAAITQAKSLKNNCIACHMNLPIDKRFPK